MADLYDAVQFIVPLSNNDEDPTNFSDFITEPIRIRRAFRNELIFRLEVGNNHRIIVTISASFDYLIMQPVDIYLRKHLVLGHLILNPSPPPENFSRYTNLLDIMESKVGYEIIFRYLRNIFRQELMKKESPINIAFSQHCQEYTELLKETGIMV